MPEAHSYWSASGFARDLACPGSKILSEGREDRVGESAAWGTVAHDYGDQHLKAGTLMDDGDLGVVHEQDGHTIVVTSEMIECVNDYVTTARRLSEGADMTWSEQRVNYAAWLNVEQDQAWGTLDFSAVWIERRHLMIGDLKTGKGVAVSPTENEQGMLYAAGKLLELDALGIEVDTIDIAIVQNRISSEPKVWSTTRAELEDWLTGRARSGVVTVENARRFVSVMPDTEWQATFLRPGDHCRDKFCKARATCPALRNEVAGAVFDSAAATPEDFENLTATKPDSASSEQWLAAALAKVDLIEDWCKEIRAEAHSRLTKGQTVPGFKLVQGKRGNRTWADPVAAEQMLKTFRVKLEDMYDLKLISPTSAEKLAKAETIGKRQWPKLQALITQAEGKPSVAPVSDPREAITVQPVADAFEAVADINDLI